MNEVADSVVKRRRLVYVQQRIAELQEEMTKLKAERDELRVSVRTERQAEI